MDDWAKRFMPNPATEAKEEVPYEDPAPQPPIPAPEPTPTPVEETLSSAMPHIQEIVRQQAVLMSALDIIRNDLKLNDNNHNQTLLALTEVIAQLNSRVDALQGAMIRKLGQLEFALQQPPPEPMTNIMEVAPELVDEIRTELSNVENAEPDIPPIRDVNPHGYHVKKHPEDVLGGVKRSEEDEGPTIHDLVQGVPAEILESYHAWKHGGASNGWHDFMRVCKGPKEAKRFKELIEEQLGL